mgnify:FL=1
MSGMANWKAKIELDIKDLQKQLIDADEKIDKFANEDRKVKLDIDTKTLESAIQKLDKMLDSLGKGTGDFKQFETLSVQLSSITTDINNISKAFSAMNDGTELANNIKSINTSLTALSNHFVSEMSGKMASSIKEVKSTLSDVGDGDELTPLLQTINNIESAINKLSSSIKGIGLNMNIDFGSDTEMEAKAQAKISNALQAYQNLFNHIKMSSAGGSLITQKFFDFDINQFDTPMSKLQAYIKFIKDMREEAKKMFGGQDILKIDTDNKYWNRASAAMGQVKKTFNEMKAATDTNPLENIFGKTDLTEVIAQLGSIAGKLDEISNSTKNFVNIFKGGLDVTASVQEVTDLTNRVKELEAELVKIKGTTIATSQTKLNIPNGHSENAESATVRKYKRVDNGIPAVDVGNHDNEIKVSSRTELEQALKSLQAEIIASINTSTSFVKEVTDFYDSQDKLVKTQMKVSDNSGNMRTYTTSYSKDKDGNATAWTSHIDTQKFTNQSKEELEVQKQITAEIEAQSKANQKKYQEFQREEQAYQKEQNQIAYNKLTDTIRQYSEVAKRISSGKAEDGDLQNMTQLEEKISQLQKQPILSESQVAKSESSLNSLYDQLDKIEKKLQETNQQKVGNRFEKLSTYRGKSDKYSDTLKKFNDGGWVSNEYIKNVNAVSEALKTYQAALKNVDMHELITSEDIDLLDKYESKLKQAISTVQNMTAAQKGYDQLAGEKELNKISQILRENSNMSEKAKAEIRDYYHQIKSGNPSASLGVIHGKILDIVNAEERAGRAGKSLWDTFKTSRLHQMVAQVAGMFSFYDAINTGKKVFSTINELDYALIDLKKTTSMSRSELNQFYYDSNDVAKQMGVTTKEIIDQASSWSRLGYSSKQASTEMAKLSSQFASISPGMSTEESQSGLVSIMKAWSIDPDQVKSEIMDPINQLGNTMAEDNQDIIDGMERSAAALAAVGTSTKDAFALFSGIQEVLQNAEKSGTSLRSVALRLRSFDETTEEYSSDLENITGELVNLTKTAEHAEGISVFKPGSTTEFKDLTDYFREIAGIWDEMSQKQQNDYLLKAFGRTQAQGGAALIQNFQAVDKALDEMNQSIGSSDREMETVQQSLTYKLNELKETWVGIVQQTVERGDISNILSGLTGISNVLGVIINKIGVGKTLLAGVSAFIGRDKSKERFCPSW